MSGKFTSRLFFGWSDRQFIAVWRIALDSIGQKSGIQLAFSNYSCPQSVITPQLQYRLQTPLARRRPLTTNILR